MGSGLGGTRGSIEVEITDWVVGNGVERV